MRDLILLLWISNISLTFWYCGLNTRWTSILDLSIYLLEYIGNGLLVIMGSLDVFLGIHGSLCRVCSWWFLIVTVPLAISLIIRITLLQLWSSITILSLTYLSFIEGSISLLLLLTVFKRKHRNFVEVSTILYHKTTVVSRTVLLHILWSRSRIITCGAILHKCKFLTSTSHLGTWSNINGGSYWDISK